MADNYQGSFGCSNCGWEGVMDVSKGTTLRDHADSQSCPNCGCKTIFAYQG